MNTSAYLQSQGWLGAGHSLPTSSGHPGLSKPLLVSQKRNLHGVGKKTHTHADQWWARAFDSSLKGLNVGGDGVHTTDNGEFVNGEGGGVKVGGEEGKRDGGSRALEMLRCGGAKWVGVEEGGLYGRFVKGEGMKGTIGQVRVKRKRERRGEDQHDGRKVRKTEGTTGVKEPDAGARDQEIAHEELLRKKRKEKKMAKKSEGEGKRLRDAGSPEAIKVPDAGVKDQEIAYKELLRKKRREKKIAKGKLPDRSEAMSASEDLGFTKAERRKRRREKKAPKVQDGTLELASVPTSSEVTLPNEVRQGEVSSVTPTSEDALLERKRRKAAKKALKALSSDLGATAVRPDPPKKERSRKHKLQALGS